MRRILYIVLFLSAVSAIDAEAQVDRREVRKGNRYFKKESYKEADIEYRKALVKDSLSVAANYNLANTLYRLDNMEEATKVMERIKEVAPTTDSAADYYYNMGDIAIASKNWQAAVDAFKQSLLRNPGDLDAKENYIYAKKMLENQQQQQQNQDQNQDQNQQQGQQPKITPQAAQQMLQAIQAKEKETQDKVNKEKAKALNSRQKEKNW